MKRDEEAKRRAMSLSNPTTHQDFELIVGEIEQENSQSSTENATDPYEDSEIGEIMENLRKKDKPSSTGLSSSATTVSSLMAQQFLSQLQRNRRPKPMSISEDQEAVMHKIVHEELYPQQGTAEMSIRDILMLYRRGLEAHHEGRYREMFANARPCIPYFNTNVLVWIRISEALIYEYYEETWEFCDIYNRLFHGRPCHHVPSSRRRTNELRRRHEDMTLAFAETATLMTYLLAKQSSREPVHYAAASLYGFMLLKLRKYTEALDAVNFAVDRYDRTGEWQDELSVLLTYKAEAMLGIGRYNRAIEYCHRVIKGTQNTRAKHRAIMLIAMAYMRKCNFKRAQEYVISILSDGRLDEAMLENVAILGLNLSHLMGNLDLFRRFEEMLQRIVR